MEKDDKQRAPRLEVLDTAAEILGNHGKNDDEIRAFLEKQFSHLHCYYGKNPRNPKKQKGTGEQTRLTTRKIPQSAFF